MMIILISALILILLTYITINYLNKNEGFNMVIYNDINDYLKKNIDDNILRDSYCFDNDKLLGNILGNKNITCANHLEKVANIYYKYQGMPTADELSEKRDQIFYDSNTGKTYSFAEICPITTNQLNSTLCLRKHNNDISDTIFRLDNIITDTEIKMQDKLIDVESEITKYRDDKYRLFNSTEIQNYYNKTI
jgi:hypothetical protein